MLSMLEMVFGRVNVFRIIAWKILPLLLSTCEKLAISFSGLEQLAGVSGFFCSIAWQLSLGCSHTTGKE
jgi:hypothetical protein